MRRRFVALAALLVMAATPAAVTAQVGSAAIPADSVQKALRAFSVISVSLWLTYVITHMR